MSPTTKRSCCVDPLDVEAIAEGLVTALSRPNDAAALERRRASVSPTDLAKRRARSSGRLAMKVALDVSAVPPRIAGAGRYIAELAVRLPECHVDTTLVTRRDDAARWSECSPHASLASIVPNARAARLAYEAWVLGTSHVARDVDLWHAPHYTMPRRWSTPTVVTIHDLTFFTNPEWHERTKVTFFRRAITFAAQHARVLVSVSAFSARLLEEILPAHAPIVVAPLGVDLAHFQPLGRDDSPRFSAILSG